MAWAGALVVPLALTTWLALALGQVALVHDQSQSVADLAALAAAQASGDPCSAARQVLDVNAQSVESPGMTLAACEVVGRDARITVHAQVPTLATRALGWLGVDVMDVVARARAGSG